MNKKIEAYYGKELDERNDAFVGRIWFSTSNERHNPKFKRVVNTILRTLQFYTKEPYLLVSKFVFREYKQKEKSRYEFFGYGLEKVILFDSLQEKKMYDANRLLEEVKNEQTKDPV